MMKAKKYWTLIILFFISVHAKSETLQLSSQSKVVMFTCGPGTELYAGFGHSALWISDPLTGIDRLYNYGTFDFNTPKFYWKFIKGRLNYMLTETTIQRFMYEYKYRKIRVTGQTLNLNINERQKLFELLEENMLPENRFYKYDFFYDNCATRIRDIVVASVDGKIDFNTPNKHLSFRQMLFPYLTHTPWTKMGINLILGLSSDKIATPDQYMYLPAYMQNEFNNAIINSDGNSRKLVKAEKQYLPLRLEFKYNVLTDPVIIFTALFLIIVLLTFVEMRICHYFLWLDIVINLLAALGGLFLFFMWVGADHSATNQNMNILWLFPSQTLFLIALLFKGNTRKQLIWFAFGLIVFMAIFMQFWPQESEVTFLIICIIYAFRYLFHQRIIQKKESHS